MPWTVFVLHFPRIELVALGPLLQWFLKDPPALSCHVEYYFLFECIRVQVYVPRVLPFLRFDVFVWSLRDSVVVYLVVQDFRGCAV